MKEAEINEWKNMFQRVSGVKSDCCVHWEDERAEVNAIPSLSLGDSAESWWRDEDVVFSAVLKSFRREAIMPSQLTCRSLMCGGESESNNISLHLLYAVTVSDEKRCTRVGWI